MVLRAERSSAQPREAAEVEPTTLGQEPQARQMKATPVALVTVRAHQEGHIPAAGVVVRGAQAATLRPAHRATVALVFLVPLRGCQQSVAVVAVPCDIPMPVGPLARLLLAAALAARQVMEQQEQPTRAAAVGRRGKAQAETAVKASSSSDTQSKEPPYGLLCTD